MKELNVKKGKMKKGVASAVDRCLIIQGLE